MSTIPQSLTNAQLTMLRECAKYALCKNYGASGYYRLGGSGSSPLRRDDRTRNTLEKLGLITSGSVIKATDKGHELLNTLQSHA